MTDKHPGSKNASIDGILKSPSPASSTRSISINKETPNPSTKTQRIVSLQPRRSIDGIKIASASAPMTTLRAKMPHASLPSVKLPYPKLPHRSGPSLYRRSSVFPQTDVVVKLPRSHMLRARLSSVLQYVAVITVALVSTYSTTIGQWLILAYAVFVITTRRDSRLSFGIALFLLIAIPIFQLLGQSGVANNIAIYVYELLVVGVVQAMIELKWPIKSKELVQ